MIGLEAPLGENMFTNPSSPLEIPFPSEYKGDPPLVHGNVSRLPNGPVHTSTTLTEKVSKEQEDIATLSVHHPKSQTCNVVFKTPSKPPSKPFFGPEHLLASQENQPDQCCAGVDGFRQQHSSHCPGFYIPRDFDGDGEPASQHLDLNSATAPFGTPHMDEFAQLVSSGYPTDDTNLQTPVNGFKIDNPPYNTGSLPQSFIPLEFDSSGKNGEPVVFDNAKTTSIFSQNVSGLHVPKKTPLSAPAEINNQSATDSDIQPSVINVQARAQDAKLPDAKEAPAEVEEDLESFRLRLEAALATAQFEEDIQVIVHLSPQEVDDLTNNAEEPTIDPAGSFWNDSDGESHPAMDVDHSLPGPHQGEDVSGRSGSYVTGGQVDSEHGGGGGDQWEVDQGMTLNVSQ
jgi:hypothetical protein